MSETSAPKPSDSAPTFEEVWIRLQSVAGIRNQSELAALLGVSAASVSDAKKRGFFPLAWAFDAARKLQVSLDFILLGDMRGVEGQIESVPAKAGTLRAGDPIATAVLRPVAPDSNVIECADCQIIMVPMVEARLSAGTGSFEVGENVERRYAFRTDFLMRKGQPSSMVLMRVTGNSMEPDIKHNDVVLIDQSQCTPRPGLLYAVGVEDLVYLKSVNAEPGKLILSSYNPDYPPLEIDARGDLSNGIRIIGRAVWVGRELS